MPSECDPRRSTPTRTVRRVLRTVLVAMAIAGLHLATDVVASAETFVVTTVADSAVGACGSHCSLREAVSAANAARGDGPHTILVPVSGHYRFSPPSGDDDDNQEGDLDIRANISITNVSNGPVTLGAHGEVRILDIRPPGSSRGSLTLSGVDIIGDPPIQPVFLSYDSIIRNNGDFQLLNSSIRNVYSLQTIIDNTGNLEIYSTEISQNVVDSFSRSIVRNNGILKLTNVTISGNYTRDAIIVSTSGLVAMNHVTIAENTNHAVRLLGALRMEVFNTIIARHHGTPPCNGLVIIGSNNFEDASGSVLSCGPTFAATDQLALSSLQANGGRTLTHALGPGSVAIDAGAAWACPSQDQRGISRPRGLGCDVGAFETGSSTSSANLNVIVAAESATVEPGGVANFDVVVRNDGPTTVNAFVQTTHSMTGLRFLSWTCQPMSGRAETCHQLSGSGDIAGSASIPQGGGVSYRVVARVSLPPGWVGSGLDGSSIWLRAFVTGDYGVDDPNGANNDSTALTIAGRRSRVAGGATSTMTPDPRLNQAPGAVEPGRTQSPIMRSTRRQSSGLERRTRRRATNMAVSRARRGRTPQPRDHPRNRRLSGRQRTGCSAGKSRPG
jgi:CSLREA domain-containing protein/uncharacterized repeat protein (TIGR01451 family)